MIVAREIKKNFRADIFKHLDLADFIGVKGELFTTKAGEDYSWASNMKTTGEDNVLRLTVTVH